MLTERHDEEVSRVLSTGWEGVTGAGRDAEPGRQESRLIHDHRHCRISSLPPSTWISTRPTFSVHTMVRDCLSVSMSHLCSYARFSFRLASRIQPVAGLPLNHLPPAMLHMMMPVGIPLDSLSYQTRVGRHEWSRPPSSSSNHRRRDSLQLQRRMWLSGNCSLRYPSNSWSTDHVVE